MSLFDKLLHADSWQNMLTYLGTGKDKAKAAVPVASAPLQEQTLNTLYEDGDIEANIVNRPPVDCFRQGYVLQGLDESKPLTDEDKRLKLNSKLLEAWIWGRLYGGCLLVVGVEDGKTLADELTPDKPVQGIRTLHVVPRWGVTHVHVEENLEAENYDEPFAYDIQFKQLNQLVHASKVIRFDGAMTSKRWREQNNYWTQSVLQRPYEALQQFAQIWQGTTTAMTEAVVAEFKIRGLIQAIAETGTQAENTVLKRMQMANLAKSIARAMVVDAEQESFRRDVINFTGMGTILEQAMYRVAAAADRPVTLLFGRAPAGMNATGESDMRQWYDRVRSEQNTTLKPHLLTLYTMIAQGLNINHDELDIEFNSLWQTTAKEEQEAKKIQADIDKIYLDAVVLYPEEVAANRFGETGYSYDTTLDEDLRKLETGEEDETTTKGFKLPDSELPVLLKVNQALESIGLPPWPNDDGELTLAELRAKHEVVGEATGKVEAKELTGGTADPPNSPIPPQAPIPPPTPSEGSKDPDSTQPPIPPENEPPVPPNPDDDPPESER